MEGNRRFNPDGSIQSRRVNEDGYCSGIFNSTNLLMVLDGHNGNRAQEYAKEEMPGAIIKMVEDTVKHEEIKAKLVEIFENVDNGFFHNMDHLLDERRTIKMVLDVSKMIAVVLRINFPPDLEMCKFCSSTEEIS